MDSKPLGGQKKMSAVQELICTEKNGTLSFGNHTLAQKEKKEGYEFDGDLYKVKTSQAMTKLEREGIFVYESVPGTSVNEFTFTQSGVKFKVEGAEDAQITVGLADETEYEVLINQKSIGRMKTNLGGKLNVGVELANEGLVDVEIIK